MIETTLLPLPASLPLTHLLLLLLRTAQLSFAFHAKRIAFSSIFNVVLPVLCITSMSFGAFLLPRKHSETRVGVCITAFLAAIAFSVTLQVGGCGCRRVVVVVAAAVGHHALALDSPRLVPVHSSSREVPDAHVHLCHCQLCRQLCCLCGCCRRGRHLCRGKLSHTQSHTHAPSRADCYVALPCARDSDATCFCVCVCVSPTTQYDKERERGKEDDNTDVTNPLHSTVMEDGVELVNRAKRSSSKPVRRATVFE